MSNHNTLLLVKWTNQGKNGKEGEEGGFFFCWEELMYQVEGHLIAESHISCIS